MTPAIRNTIIRNTLYAIIGRIWTLLVGFLLVPYMIQMVGVERFGIWSLLSILVGYFALLDLGIGVSFTRFIAEEYTAGNTLEINRIVNSGFVFYLCAALPVIAIAFVGREWIFSLLQINQAAYPDAVLAYYGTLGIFFITAMFSGFVSILQGLQRIDLVNKIAVGVTVPNVIATIIFLNNGLRLDGLLWANMITAGSGLLCSLVAAKRIFPHLRFSPAAFSRETMSRLLRFGLKMQFSKLVDLSTFQSDKAFVSYFAGVGSVTYYHLGTQINWRIRDLPLLLLSSLLPAASELNALKDRHRLFSIYERGTKYLAFVSIPLMLFLIATAPLIMELWLGPGYRLSATISQILALGYTFNVLVGVGSVIAAGMNEPDFQLRGAVITGLANVSLVLLLGHFFGVMGVAVGVTVSLTTGPSYFIYAFHRYLKQPIYPFLKGTIGFPLVLSLAGMLVLWGVNSIFGSALQGRVINGTVFLAEVLLFFPAYLILIMKSRYFDSVDRELFVNNYLFSKLQRILHA